MSGLVQAEKRVEVRCREDIHSMHGSVSSRTHLELARWEDGTLVLGGWMVEAEQLLEGIRRAAGVRASSTKTNHGRIINIERVIVPSLVPGHPGVLVVDEPRMMLPPRGRRLGLQTAQDGLMAAPAIYRFKPDDLVGAIESAPVLPGAGPRPKPPPERKPNRATRRGRPGR